MLNISHFAFSKIKYIDTHSHLHDKAFDFDRFEVIKNMVANNIATIAIGTDLRESEKAKEIAGHNENIFYTVGLHPHDNLKEFHNLFSEDGNFDDKKGLAYFGELKILAEDKKCLAIGEFGLDYFYLYKDYSENKITKVELDLEKEKQKIIFEQHLDLARILNLPIMLHIRPSNIINVNLNFTIVGIGLVDREDAYLEAIEIIKNYQEKFNYNLKGNFHFFVSTKNILEIILKDIPNFSISISGVCTFANEYDELIKFCPNKKIHLETDSPYVIPKNRRKEYKRNEPNFVIDIFEKVCDLKNIKNKTEKEDFKSILKENFERLYLKNIFIK